MDASVLAEQILAVLRESSRPLLGREIVAEIADRTGSNVEARSVNRLLFGPEMQGKAARGSDYRWRIIPSTSTTGQSRDPGSSTGLQPSEAPSCPLCGTSMTLRIARQGTRAGQQFWGCTAYPSCRGIRPLGPGNRDEDVARGQSVGSEAEAGQMSPVTVRARPLVRGMSVAFFDYLTVPAEGLENAQDTETIAVGRQWRCEYEASVDVAELSPEVQRAVSVLDKLIARGHVTLLSSSLEETLRKSEASGSKGLAPQADLAHFEFDSDEERQLATVWLKKWLGDDWLRWTTPQLESGALIGSSEAVASQQRVDFLVHHPGLLKPLVIEVDGRKGDNTQAIRARDTALSMSGYETIRIPAAEVRAGSGAVMEKLRQILDAARASPIDGEVFRSRWRRAGQIQLVLSHAINLGLIDPVARTPIVVSTDAVERGDLSPPGFRAVLEDLQELAVRVGRLYGVELLPGRLQASAKRSKEKQKVAQEVHISFYGAVGNGLTFHVSDTSLPVQIAWQPRSCTPGLPVSFTESACLYFLERIFRKPSFLEGQYAAIERALSGEDAIVLLPTGAGKSIAFQLAAFLLPGAAVVVDPILSLIRDQIDVLSTYGIDRAIGITSDLTTRGEKKLAYERVLGGDNLFHYIAPERFQIEEFRKALRAMKMTVPVGLIVVDEAHCVSEWGHDFRTSYLRLADNARECCGGEDWTPPLLALTGTASRSVLKDLQRELKIFDFDAVITPRTFDRSELDYVAIRCSSEEKREMLRALLGRHLPGKLRIPPESFGDLRGDDTLCGLVFCPWAGGEFGVMEVAAEIARTGLRAEPYSGKKPSGVRGTNADWSRRRRQTERAFKRNQVAVLACTKAFGMGIDKQNVRYTVHYGLPPSIEAFYQEAGRAGRDRRTSYCCLLASDDHQERNDRLLAPDTPVEEIQRAISGRHRTNDDDVTRMLFFQTRAFAGIGRELAALSEVAHALEPLDRVNRREISPGRRKDGEEDPRTAFEKALHRLVVLGVVSDYTVQYSGPTYDVRVAGATRDQIIDSYVDYVGAYQGARAVQERAKAEAIGDRAQDSFDFVMAMGQLYLEFVYEVIEKGRRRAISEMRAAAKAKDAKQFRARILRYLESTEFSERLDAIVESTGGGLAAATTLLGEIISPRDADSVRGQVGRYLESYPDHPALLLLRALSEALARQPDWVLVEDNLVAFIHSACDKYACPADQVAAATATALRVLGRRRLALAQQLERRFFEAYPDREQARLLVAEAGVESAGLTSWRLLDELAVNTRTLMHINS